VLSVSFLLTTPSFAQDENISRHLTDLIREGDVQGVKKLIQADANINYIYSSTVKTVLGKKTCNGVTGLIDATEYGHFEIVKALIDAGAHVNATKECFGFFNKTYSSPLSVAALNGNMEIVQLLVENGAHVSNKAVSKKRLNLSFNSVRHRNPVSEAIKGQHGDVALYLLKHGGVPNSGDFIGSIKLNNIRLTQALLDAGTGACERELSENKLAHMYAFEMGHKNLANFLHPLVENCPPLQNDIK